jgi:hypothetical protein
VFTFLKLDNLENCFEGGGGGVDGGSLEIKIPFGCAQITNFIEFRHRRRRRHTPFYALQLPKVDCSVCAECNVIIVISGCSFCSGLVC